MRDAAAKRGVDIVPLQITFNCRSGLTYGQPTSASVRSEIAMRILLDASAADWLDERFYSRRNVPFDAAVNAWIAELVRNASRDVVIVMAVDEITLITVQLEVMCDSDSCISLGSKSERGSAILRFRVG